MGEGQSKSEGGCSSLRRARAVLVIIKSLHLQAVSQNRNCNIMISLAADLKLVPPLPSPGNGKSSPHTHSSSYIYRDFTEGDLSLSVDVRCSDRFEEDLFLLVLRQNNRAKVSLDVRIRGRAGEPCRSRPPAVQWSLLCCRSTGRHRMSGLLLI